MKHVMVDLETLGTVPGCAILSIGAVEFFPETGKMGKEFYIVINRASCADALLSEDHTPVTGTVAWWDRQSDEAKVVLAHAADKKKSVPLAAGLEKFNDFIKSIGNMKEVLVYGNGADFDNPILEVAFDCAGVKRKWGNYHGRCYRSLKNLHDLFGPLFQFTKAERSGTYHNALDDAKTQAVHLMDNVMRIRKALKLRGL